MNAVLIFMAGIAVGGFIERHWAAPFNWAKLSWPEIYQLRERYRD